MPPTSTRRKEPLAAWRRARPSDDDAIVAMCLAFNREDPGLRPVRAAQVRRTLETLRRQPLRGRAVVLADGGRRLGYAFLISFWSNERGGEVCDVDEIYVVPEERGHGHGSALFAALRRGKLWGRTPIAIELGVTPSNRRARRLYERLGFVPWGTAMALLRP